MQLLESIDLEFALILEPALNQSIIICAIERLLKAPVQLLARRSVRLQIARNLKVRLDPTVRFHRTCPVILQANQQLGEFLY